MWIDNASEIDFLFYEPYVEIISEIALNPEYKPLTIGVFGIWGSGKSTLLKLVENKISDVADKRTTICVTINSWSFEGYEDAKIAVMEALLQELHEKAPIVIKKKIRELLKKLIFLRYQQKQLASLPHL